MYAPDRKLKLSTYSDIAYRERCIDEDANSQGQVV